MNQNPCLPCIPAKKNNPKLEKSSRSHLSDIQVGELLSGDIIGKIQPPTRNGDIYFTCLWTRNLGVGEKENSIQLLTILWTLSNFIEKDTYKQLWRQC
jgi:hypothetical protein